MIEKPPHIFTDVERGVLVDIPGREPARRDFRRRHGPGCQQKSQPGSLLAQSWQ